MESLMMRNHAMSRILKATALGLLLGVVVSMSFGWLGDIILRIRPIRWTFFASNCPAILAARALVHLGLGIGCRGWATIAYTLIGQWAVLGLLAGIVNAYFQRANAK